MLVYCRPREGHPPTLASRGPRCGDRYSRDGGYESPLARGRPLEIGTARRATRAPRRQERVGRCGALLPLFRLVGVPCIAALRRVESLPRHRGDRPKLNSSSRDLFDLGRAQQNGSPSWIRIEPCVLLPKGLFAGFWRKCGQLRAGGRAQNSLWDARRGDRGDARARLGKIGLERRPRYFDQACQRSIPVNGAVARAKLLTPFMLSLMLTGPRREEVAGMTWAELSEDLATWTIPAHADQEWDATSRAVKPAREQNFAGPPVRRARECPGRASAREAGTCFPRRAQNAVQRLVEGQVSARYRIRCFRLVASRPAPDPRDRAAAPRSHRGGVEPSERKPRWRSRNISKTRLVRGETRSTRRSSTI